MSTAPNPRHVITRKVADHLGFVLSAAQLQRLHRVIDRLADGDDADLAARCTPGSAAFDELAASVLVGETYWFRDQRQLQVIADLLADRPPERRRIWSAGCSTGQEAWSLLITLHRAGVWPAEVVATDIHGPSVHTAALGAYPLVRQRGLDADTAATYGAAEGPTWTVREDLRRRLTAVRHDLLRDAPLPADVIICRNVLIYLTATAATTALNRFAGALQGDGVLVLGHAETPMARSGWMIEGHGDVHLLRPDLAPSPTRSISDAPPARGTARGADRPAPTPDVPPPTTSAGPAATGPPSDPEADVALRQGEAALEQDRPHEAVVLLRRARYLRRDDPVAAALLGVALARAGHAADARRSWEVTRRLLDDLPPDSVLAGGYPPAAVRGWIDAMDAGGRGTGRP